MANGQLFEHIEAAARTVRPFVQETLLCRSQVFEHATGAQVWFKCENLQQTGSFKYRGATNRIHCATPEEFAAGFVTASTGNHGAGFSCAAALAEASGIVFVPEGASEAKLENMRRYGADIREHGDDGVVTEQHARAYAEQHGKTFVSPYNDILVAAGQGTVAVELVAQMPAPADVVLVALGGGGLISGIAGYLKQVWPQVQVIGCSPQNSRVMIDSVAAGQILDLPSLPTLSDGTAGGVEPGAITFDLVRDLVDEFDTVSEAQIAEAMRLYMKAHNQLLEGAAGVAVATLIKRQAVLAGKRVAVIICGGNISLSTLKQIL